MKKDHSRQEIDPEAIVPAEVESPPEKASQLRADDEDIVEALNGLIERVAGETESFDRRLVRELMTAALKLIPDGRDTGELKLMTAAIKELRYAYRVFGDYPEPHKVTIFGSARTNKDHPDYLAAIDFGREMAQAGWMIITGAGGGIMEAGHVGPGREASFGVAIRLPFETTANEVIAGDEKLIHFRYFFTRKLMFLSQAEAVVLFPGGFGTLDEAYETLTLVQTGKASPVPIVMVEGVGGCYWRQWEETVRINLLSRGLIGEDDLHLYHIASDPADAVEHILKFYRNYHSSRYVRDDFVIRLRHKIDDAGVAALNDEFANIVKEGSIVQRGAYDVETEHRDLPRIAFTHTRNNFGKVRQLIDRINEIAPAAL